MKPLEGRSQAAAVAKRPVPQSHVAIDTAPSLAPASSGHGTPGLPSACPPVFMASPPHVSPVFPP